MARITRGAASAGPGGSVFGADATIAYTANAIAPHALTVRATYTVPANKTALVASIALSAVRDGATATPSIAASLASYNAGSALTIAQAESEAGTVGDGKIAAMGTQIWLNAADVLALKTVDLSTGGTVSYALAAVIRQLTP